MSHTYVDGGTYTVTLTVRDNNGATGTKIQTVSVSPFASFTFACNGLPCSIDGSSSKDFNGTITSFLWNFGDGTTAAGAAVSHTYAAGGAYNVALKVTGSCMSDEIGPYVKLSGLTPDQRLEEYLMGIKAGNVYALGVQLGTCSYFASVGDTTNAKKGLGYALGSVNTLAGQGINLNVSELKQVQTGPTQSNMEALRGDYRNTLSNTAYLHVFDFAVGVGIAEGQASSSSSAAHTIARDSMANAAKLEKTLLDYGLVPITGDHEVIQMLRKEWQQTFSNSAIG